MRWETGCAVWFHAPSPSPTHRRTAEGHSGTPSRTAHVAWNPLAWHSMPSGLHIHEAFFTLYWVLRCFTLFPLFSVFSFWPFAAFHAKLAPWPLMHPCESHSDGGRRDNRMWGRVKTPRNGPYNLPDSIFPPASTNQAARVGKTKGFPFSRAYHEPFCEWRFGLFFSAHPSASHSRTPNPHTTSHLKLQHGLHCLHLHRLRRRPQGVQGHGTSPRVREPARRVIPARDKERDTRILPRRRTREALAYDACVARFTYDPRALFV